MYNKYHIPWYNHNPERFFEKYGESEQTIAIFNSFTKRFYDYKDNAIVPELVSIVSFIFENEWKRIRKEWMWFVVDRRDNQNIIATCKHVVQNNGSKIIQSLVDQKEQDILKILTTKWDHRLDLAFILTQCNVWKKSIVKTMKDKIKKIIWNNHWNTIDLYLQKDLYVNKHSHDAELIGVYRKGYEDQYDFRVGSTITRDSHTINNDDIVNMPFILNIINYLQGDKKNYPIKIEVCNIPAEPWFSGSPIVSEQWVVGMLTGCTREEDKNKRIAIYIAIETILQEYNRIKTKLFSY